MKEVRIIYTEIGGVPVTIEQVVRDGKTLYEGKVLGENSIFIQSETEEHCLDQLKKSFELSMHFWVRFEIGDIPGVSYEGKVKKNWFNE